MNRLTRRSFLGATTLGLAAGASAPPNVVVFFIDDMGYADPGCYGGKLAPTPHIDRMAAAGVRFTDGYVTACVCSPSRVGLITGRYQARTGHDNLTTRPGTELELGEVTMGQRMKRAGYATGIVGKWHLGATAQHLPGARGFDYAVGSVSNMGEAKFYRGTELIDEVPGAPVTTPFYTREANAFIERNRARPFFLYLPYNAVHAPHVASAEWLDRFSSIADRRRQTYAAMVAEVDDSVGKVMAKLAELKLEERTLVFLISDNGGAGALSDNGGFRGGKWKLYEGGIRVPFLAQWKGRIAGGQVCKEPVISLDVLATALAAAGVTAKPEPEIDGENLLPLLTGKGTFRRKQPLHWRYGVQWAVRQGEWKLIKPKADAQPMLFNLARDPGESKDLASAEPARTREMLALHESWNAGMRPTRWVDPRSDGNWPEAKAERAGKAGKRGKKK